MANRDQFNRGMVLPTLIKQLKSILQQYPDDGQILKELIQNAEDARARRIVFLLDSTAYSARSDKLHHNDLAAYQGPALYVYNDAVFSADDWKGITMLSDSVKEKDPMKVGRFGLGFKSVFHLTDLPSIFSGNGIGFLDPHEKFFTNDGYRTSSYLFDLKESREGIEQLQDQFLPYYQNLFGVTKETFERGSYEGTIFRFPLRMEGMKSDLCDTKYSPEKVRELFQSLKTDAHIMLLFLKSLESIEVYEKTSNSDEPTKLLSINISEALHRSVQEVRLQFINDIENRRNGNSSDSTSVTYSLDIELKRYKNTMAIDDALETSKWIISQYFAGREELGSVNAISDDLGLLPWVGVALPVTDHGKSEIPSYLVKPKGHIFCFLPLPLEEESPTGLRVHVHGYFAVDSNRRHIKWPTADQNLDQLTDKALIWNEFLVNKLVVKALIKLALHVSNPSNKFPCDLVFNIIPDQVTPQWKRMADMFFKELPSLDIFYTQTSGGKWTNCRNSFFDNREDKSELQELIRRILFQNQVNFVSVPMFLKRHFVNHLSPAIICQAFKAAFSVLVLSEQEKFLLLEYFIDSFPRGAELIGIRLVPLTDGTWTDFKSTLGERVYIESPEHPKSILPNLERLFLMQSIPVFQKMKTLAQKNVTQLTILGPQYVATLLPSVFPQHWLQADEVNLRDAPHLSQQWLTDMWTYLTRHFPSNLTQFDSFHILPIGNGQLRRLRSQIPIILSNYLGMQLANSAKSVLIKLGLKVIDELPSTVLAHQKLIGNYVLSPDITSVLSAMNTLHQSGRLLVSSMTDLDKKSLQNFLTSGLAGKAKVIATYKNLLLALPIFTTLDGSGFSSSAYVCMSSGHQGAPPELNLPVKLPTMHIDLRENLVRDLAINLGIIRKTEVEILENDVLPAVNNGWYDSDSIRKLMSFVCDNFNRFKKNSRNNFCASAGNVKFVQKLDGSLVTPREVFDTSDQILCSLFANDDVFPVGEFANPKYVNTLRQLGLKDHNSVTAADLLRVAQYLECSRAHFFIRFLESHSQLLEQATNQSWYSQRLCDALVSHRWVKPEPSRPANYSKSLQFVGETQSKLLVLPSDACSIQYSSVIGSVKSTIDVSKIPKVANCFGWTNRPSNDEVVQHLLNVVSSYDARYKNEFQLMLKVIYKFLNEDISKGNFGKKLNELKHRNWIWTGECLVTSDKIVKLKPFMDLKPHVYQLPADLKEFSHLWNFFEIAESVNLVEILREIHTLHTTSARSQDEVKRDIQFSVTILNNISTMKNKNEILDELLVPIKTKDETKLCMKSIQDVTYCDKEWFQRGYDVHDLVDDDIYLVHPLLSPETAEALMMHGIISRVLAAEELDVGFESYGQNETLTTRLRSILKDYTDGLAVLKELVQNADDAGATEVKFLYDRRQNNDSRTLLFDKGMAELQGPALWAYNNAVFTSQDFENLVKLSGATKEENNEKIGRFGLGFNAVYNLTDVPSLVSQNHVVFLDPHLKYLGRAVRDRSKPGIKLEIGNSRRQPLKDQFRPYIGIFGCKDIATGDHNSSNWAYPGTLFRFPLRTAQQAMTSEICKKCYNHEEMMTLLQLLNRSSHHLLLFTQNVTKITVFHLPENASYDSIEEWFSAEKSLEKTIRSLNNNSLCLLSSANELIRESSILKMASNVLKTPKKKKVKKNETPKIEFSLVLKVTCQNSVKFAKLNASKSGVSESHWLVTSCLGRGSSLEMARNNRDLIPVGGAAAKLHRTANGYEPVNLTSVKMPSGDSGLLYCFLPLPIPSRFPVHLNGSFALTSSRTHIYEYTVADKVDRRAQWNEVLIKDAITEAYLILLEDLLKVCGTCDSYALWPVHKSLKEAATLAILTDALYQRIFNAGPKILRENGRLLSMSECQYLEPKFRLETAGDTALEILKKMALLEYSVTDIPANVYATIAETSASKQLEARKITKLAFFTNFFLPNISIIDAEKRDQLILYMLFDQNLMGLLRSVACIPVKPRRILKMCSQLLHPESYLAVLFDEEDECFPDLKIVSGIKLNDLHQKLVELGMRNGDLSWMEISERCTVVTKIEQLVAKRLEAIGKLMNLKSFSVNPQDLYFIGQIKAVQFLPTAVKPTGFPVPWKGDEMKYTSCNMSYLNNKKNLLCCKYPIVNDHKIFGYESKPLMTLLGLADKPIDQSDLLLQLQEILRLSNSSGYVSELCPDGTKHVKAICSELYEQFDKLAGQNKLLSSTIERLSAMQSILIDSSMVFMMPDKCALNLGVTSESLLPYLAQIPKSMNTLRHLLGALKIKQRFELDDYTDVLQQLHVKYGDESLGEKDLQLALSIINSCLLPEIARRLSSGEASIDLSKIFVPDEKGILFPAESLCYNNCSWEDVTGHHFCNSGITAKTASAIGLRTIREDYMDRYSIGIPFGQKEKLVNRLRRILQGYPFDKEVLKEMLQNADDAKATEIHFINDRRHLSTDDIFEDKWRPLQGPALCIFNNKPFTKDDIVGIQNLGEGSKSEDPTKTGQYGVGFNCVYHMTDAPTFLTDVVDGDTVERILCAFDPTLKFVPGSSQTNPGRMMNNIDQLRKKFPSVFLGYFEKEYGSLGGTMFRLSLRNREISEQPDCVTNKAVTSDDVEQLFQTFRTDMYESLLFLNSVEEIHLKNADPKGNLTTLYTVHVEMTDEAKEKRMTFNEKVKRLTKDLRDKRIALKEVGSCEVSYELITRDNDGQEDKWQIIQRFGFEDPSCVPDTLNDAYSRGDIGLLPRCGVAHLKNTTRKTTKASHNRRIFCFLPLPVQIHFPSHVNGHFALDHEARRNLWSDESGGYKTEWNKCIMKHVLAPCYCALLVERRNSIICKGPVTHSLVSQFNSLLPNISEKDGVYMKILSTAVYERIGKKNLAVLPVRWPGIEHQHLWIGPCGMDEATWTMWRKMGWDGPVGMTNTLAYFDNLHSQIPEPELSASTYRTGSFMVPSYTKVEEKKKKYEIVRETLTASGFLFINCSMSVSCSFKSAKIEVETVSPNVILSFLASYGQSNTLCRLKDLPKPLRETIFKDVDTMKLLVAYCTGCDNYKGRLFGLPLLLTAEKVLCCFEQESVRYEPFFNEIVPHIQDQFFNSTIFYTLNLDSTKDTQLTKAFTVAEFAKALPSLLPPYLFKGMEEPVNIQTLKNALKDQQLIWLGHFWKFLFACQKKLESSTDSKQAAESIKNVILPLHDWCLLPVQFRQQEYLFPIQKSRGVINFLDQGILQQTLISCLKKIGIPQPLFRYFPTPLFSTSEDDSTRMYRQVLGNMSEAKSIILALEEVVKYGVVEAKLSGSECEELCRYLAKSLDSWKDTPKSIDTVRQLPIFTTMYDKQVALMKSFVYVIPSKIPRVDMESWTSKRGIIFLKSNEDISNLLKFLGCESLTETEVYCDYIFKHFEMLSRPGQLIHLRYVRDNLLRRLMAEPYRENNEQKLEREEERDSLKGSLRRLAFIPTDDDDSYVCASEFFDKKNVVFESMEDPSAFPPDPYDSEEWNDFLKNCGMISVVSQTMFCDYARQVEQQGEIVIDETVRGQSKVLISHLFSRDDTQNSDFMGRVKIIRFVEPFTIGNDRKALHDGFGKKNKRGQNMFIAFKNSITPENADVVWSAQSILPEWVTYHFVRGSDIKNRLEIQEKAKPDKVAQHIKQLCMKWAKEAHNLDPHKEFMSLALKKCYAVLKSNLQDITDDIMTVLKDTPCIFDPKNCLLVRPSQVVLRWKPKKEISPYLIRNPDDLGEFIDLFEKLGSTLDNATIDQYCMVLEVIHNAAKDSKLDPNEKEAVCKATQGFFKLLSKQKKETVTLERELFLPGSDEKLHRSSEILVDDNFQLRQRMVQFDQIFLIDLKELNILDFELESLVKKLPAYYQPQFLTSVVVETMAENFVKNDSHFVRSMETKLQSDQIKEGIMRIAWNSVKEHGKESEQRISEAVEGLKSIRFVGVNTINTYLVHKGSRIAGSERIRLFHIKEELVDEKKYCTIFIGSTATDPNNKTAMTVFYYRIACIVRRFTENIIPYDSITFLEHILKYDERAIENILDMHGLKQIPWLLNSDAKFRPIPGQFVPVDLHHLLKQDILLFKIGDFVALETADPVDNISFLTEADDTNQADETAEENSLQPTYILVKILEVFNKEDGPTIATYKIADGNGIRTVSAALLYAFHRTATDAQNVDAILEVDDTDEQITISLDEAKREIRQTLIDTWNLPEGIRKKFIKRLLLKWHPDKNPDNIKLATEATQYIFEVIQKLSQGLPVEDLLSTSQSSTSDFNSSSYSSGAYYSYISKRARKHQKAQQCFRENYARNTENIEERRREDFIKSFSVKRNPQPGEGRRWLRQAESDLKSVVNDGVDGEYPSAEWACFKCYQAAEKALKGGLYARDSNIIGGNGKGLCEMIEFLNAPDLRDSALELQHLLKSPSYMQYPTDHHQPMIPHEAFQAGTAQKAQGLAQNIVDWCRRYIGLKVLPCIT